MYGVHFHKWIMLKKTVQERSCEGLRETLDTWIKDAAAKGHLKKKTIASAQQSLALHRRRSSRSATKELNCEKKTEIIKVVKAETVEATEPIEEEKHEQEQVAVCETIEVVDDPIIEPIRAEPVGHGMTEQKGEREQHYQSLLVVMLALFVLMTLFQMW